MKSAVGEPVSVKEEIFTMKFGTPRSHQSLYAMVSGFRLFDIDEFIETDS
jgi:hypothetical protein